MEYVQFKNGSPHYYREQPDLNECIQYQLRSPQCFDSNNAYAYLKVMLKAVSSKMEAINCLSHKAAVTSSSSHDN
uniref:Uncharacterized protein n=1 Tax=Glossina pallidipes TaxID=7398 RepID=A0A1A9ZFX1_GLOPL